MLFLNVNPYFQTFGPGPRKTYYAGELNRADYLSPRGVLLQICFSLVYEKKKKCKIHRSYLLFIVNHGLDANPTLHISALYSWGYF